MQKTFLAFAASAFVLAGGIAVSQAQQGPSEPMTRPGMMMQQHGGSVGHPGSRSDTGMPGMMGRGPGPMGPGMMRMMMILIDTNGDGTLSLEEVQAVHARMFHYADADKDGQLTLKELQGFFHGNGFDTDD